MSHSLRKETNKQIRETIFVNESFNENRWGLATNAIVNASKHLFLTANIILTSSFIIYFAILFSSKLVSDFFGLEFIDVKFIVEMDPVIFGSQITLLSLVFPLVIAFVGIILQSRLGSRVLWYVYKNISGFLVFGVSSILLISIYIVLIPYKVFLSNSEVVSLSLTISIWFLFNLIILGRFFIITMNFVSPEERQELILRYTLNDVIVRDIESRLFSVISKDPFRVGLLKNKVSGQNLIEVIMFGDDSGHNFILKNKKPSVVKNIYYQFIDLAIAIQGAYNDFLLPKDSELQRKFKIQHAENSPKKELIVAQSEPLEINRISKILIGMSFSLSRFKKRPMIELRDFVQAIFGQVEDALRSENYNLFNWSVNSLRDYQEEVEKASEFRNDQGEYDNWLLLSDSSFFGMNYIDNFVREAHLLGRKVVMPSSRNGRNFDIWCNLFPNIYNHFRKERSGYIGEKYVAAHYHLWLILHDEFSSDESFSDASKHLFEAHSKSFIGSWEKWRHRLPAFDSLEVNKEALKIINTHLLNGSAMLAVSVHAGSINNAKLACDSLIYWFEFFSGYNTWHLHYGWYDGLMNVVSACQNESRDKVRLITKDDNSSIQEQQYVAFKNYWVDVRFVTIAHILFCSSSGTQDNEIYEIARHLISGEIFEANAGIYRERSKFDTSPSVISVFLRFVVCSEFEGAYADLLLRHFERLQRLYEDDVIPGRMYSGRYGDPIHIVLSLTRILTVGYSHTNFNIERHWRDFFSNDEISTDIRELTLSRLKQLKEFEDSDVSTCRALFGISEKTFDNNKVNFLDSVQNIIELIDTREDKSPTDFEVSANVIDSYSSAASISSFNLATGPFPIPLFEDIEYVEDTVNKYSLTIENVSKKSLSYLERGRLSSNEASQIDELMRKTVKNYILRSIFSELKEPVIKQYKDFDEFVRMLSSEDTEGSTHCGGDILLVGSQELWHPLRMLPGSNEAAFEDLVEVDASLSHEPSYICHINGIEVRQVANLRSSLLMKRSFFKLIKVLLYGDGRYVDTEFVTNSEDSAKGSLVLTFGIDCEFLVGSAVKYILKP